VTWRRSWARRQDDYPGWCWCLRTDQSHTVMSSLETVPRTLAGNAPPDRNAFTRTPPCQSARDGNVRRGCVCVSCRPVNGGAAVRSTSHHMAGLMATIAISAGIMMQHREKAHWNACHP
jgi:hypothetical protein